MHSFCFLNMKTVLASLLLSLSALPTLAADLTALSPTTGAIAIAKPSSLCALGRPIGSLPLPVTVEVLNDAGAVVASQKIASASPSNFQRVDSPGITFVKTHAILPPGQYQLQAIGGWGSSAFGDRTLGPSMILCDLPPITVPETPAAPLAQSGGEWLAGVPVLGAIASALGGGAGNAAGQQMPSLWRGLRVGLPLFGGGPSCP
jgi:hypothetical protein